MGVIELNGIFRAKNKTAAQWESENPILRDGELGHEKDTHKSKIGDGVNHWNDLKYDNDILLGTNILNGSHEDWIESTIGGGYKDIPGGAIYLDHTLIRGKQITYRVELKGENAQATQLGFEIRVHFTDNTDQWIARYSTGEIPERGTFEKAYTFSSQIQDKEIEFARLYPVFRSLDGGEVSGKLYVRHEFVGVGNKLPSTWSPSVADQKKYIDDKVENIQIGGVNIFSFSELEQGAINNSTGVPAASNTRLRSKSFYPISGKYISVNSFNSIYKFLWLFYDEEYSHIDDVVSWNWITSFPAIAEIPEGAAYVKYMIVRNDNAVLTPDDAKEDCLIKVELGNKPSLSWSPSVADLQVTAPVTISDFKNLPSVVTSAADGVIIPVIAPVSASNGPAGLSSTGPAYGYVQVAKTGSTKAYNFLVQMDGSGATKVYSGFLHSTAQTVSWTELGGNSEGRLRDVKYLGTSFWALISSNDTDIQAFVVDENSPEVPAEYKGVGFGFARHYRDDVGMATVTIKLNSGSVKTFNVTFYGDGSDASWEETGGSSGSSSGMEELYTPNNDYVLVEQGSGNGEFITIQLPRALKSTDRILITWRKGNACAHYAEIAGQAIINPGGYNDDVGLDVMEDVYDASSYCGLFIEQSSTEVSSTSLSLYAVSTGSAYAPEYMITGIYNISGK